MTYLPKTVLLCLTVISLLIPARAEQSVTDSLLALINKPMHDTDKCHLFVKIAKEYDRTNPDTAFYWYKRALEFAENYKKQGNPKVFRRIQNIRAAALQGFTYIYYLRDDYDNALLYLNQAVEILESIKDNKSAAILLSNRGILYNKKGDFQGALQSFNKALSLSVQNNDSEMIASAKGNMGTLYIDLSDFTRATENLLEALKIYTKLGLTLDQAKVCNNLSIVNYKQDNYNEALNYCLKSIELRLKENDKIGIANSFMTMGNIYSSMEKNTEAIAYYHKALAIHIEINRRSGQATALNNIAHIYMEEGKTDSALAIFNNVVDIAGEVGSNIILSTALNNIGSLYIERRDFRKALPYCSKSLEVAREAGLLSEHKAAARELAVIYENLNDIKTAYKYFKEFKLLNDSIFNVEKSRQAKEMEARFESEKKQLEIEKLEKDKELQNETIKLQKAENRKQQVIIFSSVLFLIFVISFSVVLARMFLQKKKANMMLARQNEEIRQQKEEIEAQRDEIETQRDVVTFQKNQLETIHMEISQSIDYATRIQFSILPDRELLQQYVSGYFVLFRPKDKVSGDFFWWAHTEGQTIVTAADCTGHGVPGAFMSMLGISCLREIVIKEYVTNPAVILKKLRKEIVKTLKQKAGSGADMSAVKDGMDMSLVSIDHNSGKILFAGANNPLYLVKKNNDYKPEDIIKLNTETHSQVSGNEVSLQIPEGNQGIVLTESGGFTLIEAKGDKMPIAIYERMDPFGLYEIHVSEGEMIYLFSDGYADQFGGVNGKKFLYKSFKKLLLEICNNDPEEQRKILDDTITSWISSYPGGEQIDDITVLGIRI